MKRYTLSLLLLFFSQHLLAQELLGQLDGSVYTDENNTFVTTLPSLDGELRDFPNAVSVYNEFVGSQDSLEFYPIPPEEIEKYKNIGPLPYHSSFVKRALIKERYADHFDKVKIVSEQLEQVNEIPLFIAAMELPGGSTITDAQGNKKDLWVALGTMVKKDRIYIYQIAVTFVGKYAPKQLPVELSEKIIDWASHTRFNS